MKVRDAIRGKTTNLAEIHDANDPRLTIGTPDEQRAARRQLNEARAARAIIELLDEIPRNELSFDALGGRMIEHVASPDGDYYRPWGGDAAFRGDDVSFYYVNEAGRPVMLERASSPSSRRDYEQRQARKEQRRADKENAAKARSKERQKARR